MTNVGCYKKFIIVVISGGIPHASSNADSLARMTYGPNETRKLAMKVEVNSQALADAVAWTTRVIDARPASPILAGIRLEAIDGTLQLSAFNYAISARHHIEAGVDESGSILVLGKLLADITKSLPAAKTYLSTDGSITDHHVGQVHLHHAAHAG